MGYAMDSWFTATDMNATILGISMLLMSFGYIVSIVNYVFSSISLFSVAKRRGLRLYGMAWVPCGSEWLLGKIADQYDRKANGKDIKLGKFLLIGSIAGIAAVLVGAVLVMVGAFQAGFADAFNGTAVTLLIVGFVLIILAYIFQIVWMVFHFIAKFKFFKSCSPRNAVWMLIIDIVTGIGGAICMFCVRKKDGGFVELQEQYTEPAEEA